MFRSWLFWRGKKKVDVCLSNEWINFQYFNIDNVDSLINRGYEAALPYKEYFRKLQTLLTTSEHKNR